MTSSKGTNLGVICSEASFLQYGCTEHHPDLEGAERHEGETERQAQNSTKESPAHDRSEHSHPIFRTPTGTKPLLGPFTHAHTQNTPSVSLLSPLTLPPRLASLPPLGAHLIELVIAQ